MRRLSALFLAAASTVSLASHVSAQQPINMVDSFRIGSEGQTQCTAQLRPFDEATRSMFDRSYAIICRDASAPVGRLYVLDANAEDTGARLAARRSGVTCGAPQAAAVEDLGQVQILNCSNSQFGVPYSVYSLRQGGKLHVAEGLSAYDSALRIGLRSVALNRAVKGQVEIATTQAGDPAAFARVQAANLDERAARLEAYRRSTAGSYADAVEFFRTAAGGVAGQGRLEASLNEALQQSNLGSFQTADRQFLRVSQEIGTDPVLARMLRNYQAIHALNRQRVADALERLDRPLPVDTVASGTPQLQRLVIDEATAKRLAAEDSGSRRLGLGDADLLPAERAEVLDAQALHLRGTILRLQGRPQEGGQALQQAIAILDRVRGGRLTSAIWMRAQIFGELAELAEKAGDQVKAEQLHGEAITVLETGYPSSPALLNAQARYASYQARRGRETEALATFEGIVTTIRASGTFSPALKRTLAPYMSMLVRRSTDDPESVAKLFVASQVLVRPGVAQTQAVLARELSSGSDEASRLFRQSINLTREVERLRVGVARLTQAQTEAGEDGAQIEGLRRQLAEAEAAQTATQAKLADYPRYRAVTDPVVELAQLQEVLRPGEAYYKLVILDDQSLAVFITPSSAKALPINVTADALDNRVTELRDTITFIEDGTRVTYAFDVAGAHQLYADLFGAVHAEVQQTRHLIFEPDGGMLRLPPNLLVTDKAGVDAYTARAADPEADAFDFTAIPWLGRNRDISTAVSVNGFRQVRLAPPSRAANSYLGFGQNKPVGDVSELAPAVRASIAVGDDCGWSIAEWSRPIAPDELIQASQTLKQRGGDQETAVVLGDAFTDTAIQQMPQLDDYRILHFATHGLVTPRRRCPARPALLTSFGGEQSDGLLSFSEIFDLKIDADLVILSACDTAGEASASVTREAGVTTGGDSALDGLVRAFVAAGGRSVIASHWPVPDTFNATERLISGMFVTPAGVPIAASLRKSQQALMNDPATSHPFYWAAFAIVGDGAAPMIRSTEGASLASASK